MLVDFKKGEGRKKYFIPQNMKERKEEDTMRGRFTYGTVSSTVFAYDSHTQYKKTRISNIGFLIFINHAPVIWYRK